jgi:hypothetical protein
LPASLLRPKIVVSKGDCAEEAIHEIRSAHGRIDFISDSKLLQIYKPSLNYGVFAYGKCGNTAGSELYFEVPRPELQAAAGNGTLPERFSL